MDKSAYDRKRDGRGDALWARVANKGRGGEADGGKEDLPAR